MKNFNKSLSILLSIAMIIGILPIGVTFADTANQVVLTNVQHLLVVHGLSNMPYTIINYDPASSQVNGLTGANLSMIEGSEAAIIAFSVPDLPINITELKLIVTSNNVTGTGDLQFLSPLGTGVDFNAQIPRNNIVEESGFHGEITNLSVAGTHEIILSGARLASNIWKINELNKIHVAFKGNTLTDTMNVTHVRLEYKIPEPVFSSDNTLSQVDTTKFTLDNDNNTVSTGSYDLNKYTEVQQILGDLVKPATADFKVFSSDKTVTNSSEFENTVGLSSDTPVGNHAFIIVKAENGSLRRYNIITLPDSTTITTKELHYIVDDEARTISTHNTVITTDSQISIFKSNINFGSKTVYVTPDTISSYSSVQDLRDDVDNHKSDTINIANDDKLWVIAEDGITFGFYKIKAFLPSEFTFDIPTKTITGYLGSNTELFIPAFMYGIGVEKIGANAFESKGITSLQIPGSVLHIERYAFSDNTLTSVTIPEGLLTVGDLAFSKNSISSLELSTTLTDIGFGAFSDNLIGTLTLPDTDLIVRGDAFRNNNLNKIIMLGDNVNFGPDVIDLANNDFRTAYSTGHAGTYVRSTGFTWVKEVVLPSDVHHIDHMLFIQIIEDYENNDTGVTGKAIKDTTGYSLSASNTVAHLFEYLTITNASFFGVVSAESFMAKDGVLKQMGDSLENHDVLIIVDNDGTDHQYSIILSSFPIITTKNNFGSYVYAIDNDDEGKVLLNVSFYITEPVGKNFNGMYIRITDSEANQILLLPDVTPADIQTDEMGRKFVDKDVWTSIEIPNGSYLVSSHLVGYSLTWNQNLELEFGAETFVVTFVDAFNNILKTETVALGGNAIAPVAPVRNGYTFLGWSNTFTNINSTRTLVPIYQIINTPEFTNPDVIVTPPTTQPSLNVSVMINGKVVNTGTEKSDTINGKTQVVFTLDSKSVNNQIDEALKTPSLYNQITVPVTGTGDSVRVHLSGDSVQKLSDNNFKISVQEKSVEYRINANEVSVLEIADKLGLTDLANLDVEVQINKFDSDELNAVITSAKSYGHSIVFEPVEFKVIVRGTVASGVTEEITVSKFNNYVERVLEIPSDVDPSTITTGVVFNKDGSYSHIPTVVFELNGKWYAKLSSLTNSKYSVVSSQIALQGLSGHWAEQTLNNMASRLILTTIKDLNPDHAVTREDFADYLVRAIGLYREGNIDYVNAFTDITTLNKQSAISAAKEWGIINGYVDGTFRADKNLTREEAIAMISKAMDIIKFNDSQPINLSATFADADSVSDWARFHVIRVCSAGILNVQSNDALSPKGILTHAEALTAIENLLIASELINE